MTIVGRNVTVGHKVLLHACEVQDDAFVGMNSTVLDGARRRDRGDGRCRRRGDAAQDRASRRIVAGNPAQKMRDLTEKDYETFKRVVAGLRRAGAELQATRPGVEGRRSRIAAAWHGRCSMFRIERGCHARSRCGRQDRSADCRSARARRGRRRAAADVAGDRRRPEGGWSGTALQPRRFGGCEARHAERRAGISPRSGEGCGSTAWSFVQHLTHNFMLSQWPDQGQHDVWDADPACLVSGIFIPSRGRARSVEGGYVLTGRWPLVSGVNTADWCLFAAIRRRRRRRPRIATTRCLAVTSRSSIPGIRSDSRARRATTWWSPTCSCRSIERWPSDSSRRPDPRQCDQREPALSHAELLHLRRLISAPLVLGIAEAGLELYLDGARGRLALTSGQKVGGYPTQQSRWRRRAPQSPRPGSSCSASAMRPAPSPNATDCRTTSNGRSSRSHAAFAGRLAARTVDLLWDAGAQQQRLQQQSDVARFQGHERRRPPLHAELGRQRLDPWPRADGLRTGDPTL